MTLTKKLTVLAATAVIAFGAALSPAMAATKLGVVDMGKVLRTTNAAQEVIKELDGKRKEFQTEVEKQEKALLDFEQKVAKDRQKMSDSDFEKKRTEFQKRVNEARQKVQERKNVLDKAFVDTMGKLRLEILKVTADIAKEKGLTAVVNQEALLLADPSMDITDAVVAGVNKNVKKIPVVYPKK